MCLYILSSTRGALDFPEECTCLEWWWVYFPHAPHWVVILVFFFSVFQNGPLGRDLDMEISLAAFKPSDSLGFSEWKKIITGK